MDLWWTLCRVGRRWNSLEYCWKTKVERTRIAWAIGSSALSFVVFCSFPSLNQRIIRAHPSDVGAVGASQLRFAQVRKGLLRVAVGRLAGRRHTHAVARRCPCNYAATPWGRNEGALLRRVCLSSPWHEFWAQEYQECLEKLRKQRMLNAEESYDFPPSNIRMLYDAFVCGNFVRHGQTTSLLSKAQGQSCRLGQFSRVFRSFLLQFAASDLATRIATSIAFPGVAALGFCCGRQHPGLDFWQISAKFRYQTDTKFRYQIVIFMPFEAFVDVSLNFAGEHSLWLAIGERRRIWTWGQSADNPVRPSEQILDLTPGREHRIEGSEPGWLEFRGPLWKTYIHGITDVGITGWYADLICWYVRCRDPAATGESRTLTTSTAQFFWPSEVTKKSRIATERLWMARWQPLFWLSFKVWLWTAQAASSVQSHCASIVQAVKSNSTRQCPTDVLAQEGWSDVMGMVQAGESEVPRLGFQDSYDNLP